MTKPWGDIKLFYQDLVDRGWSLQGMVQLIEQIDMSRYAAGIHGETSVYDLRVVQREGTILSHDSYLRVSPLFDGTMELRYVDTHIKERQWSRVAKHEEAFSTVVEFLHELHWFGGDIAQSE
jgi:hypothetical protein